MPHARHKGAQRQSMRARPQKNQCMYAERARQRTLDQTHRKHIVHKPPTTPGNDLLTGTESNLLTDPQFQRAGDLLRADAGLPGWWGFPPSSVLLSAPPPACALPCVGVDACSAQVSGAAVGGRNDRATVEGRNKHALFGGDGQCATSTDIVQGQECARALVPGSLASK